MKNLLTLAIVALLAASCCNKNTACNQSCKETCDKTCNAACKETCCAQTKSIESITFDNSYFYPNGTFDTERAKDAYIALMEYHGYPVYPGMREAMGVSDYGKGQFTKIGLAYYCPINNEEDLYMLQDLYLLPGQMLPEHFHVKPAGSPLPVKMEAWFVRHGESFIVGIGEDNLAQFPFVVIPAEHEKGTVTVKHVVDATPGTLVKLLKAESHHWQFGGPEGAIITEVANIHSNPGVGFLDQEIYADWKKNRL